MAIPTRANSSAEVLSDCNEFGYNDGSDHKLGDLSEGGLRMAINVEEKQVRSGSQREIYTRLRGAVDQQWSGELLNFNVNNVAFALGLDEDADNITGTGTSGDPYVLDVDPDVFGEQAARTYYAKGARVDGDIVRAEATARVYAPNIEWVLKQGDPAVIPFVLTLSGAWAIKTWTP